MRLTSPQKSGSGLVGVGMRAVLRARSGGLLFVALTTFIHASHAAGGGPVFPHDSRTPLGMLAANDPPPATPATSTAQTNEPMPERWVSDGLERVERVWDFKLGEVQGSNTGEKDPITVGKIVDGIVLFFAGIVASRYISRFVGRWLLARMGVNASAAAAFQSVAFYVLFLVFTLLTLNLLDVPLTAFTVAGGAVALGVGFGSQNIVNNFISGLILLAERPVKVGDLIQVGELYGNVEHIGARSTRVKTCENLDIIVPNSTFLQTNVINWTRNDNHMRTCVRFGVTYGSPMGKVRQLALKAVANHNAVFDKPPPFILFAEFGDNALLMELHFWVAVQTLTERQAIESDIRFNIDHLFREAGVVIAYPQRDMHLFAEQPLRVQMLPLDDDGKPQAA
jgi:small-conductance mechanosensitive channel